MNQVLKKKGIPSHIAEHITDFNKVYYHTCDNKIWCRRCKVHIGKLDDHNEVHRLLKEDKIRLVHYNHTVSYDCKMCRTLDCWCQNVIEIEEHVKSLRLKSSWFV